MSPEFNVLLDKQPGVEERGFRAGGSELLGQAFYRTGETGVADSVQAVQEAGLIQVPTYMLVNGRKYAARDEPAWNEWHDSLGERLTLVDDKGILGKKGQLYVVDIQNGGLFMPDHQKIRDAVEQGKLKNRAMPISAEEKELLFDGKSVYQFKDGKVQAVEVGDNFFTSYDAFREASADPDFLKSMPTYTVIRTAEEARKNPSGYQTILVQLQNPDLIIPAGGKQPLRNMLMEKAEEGEEEKPRFGWAQFGSRHDGYQNTDSGRVVVPGDGSDGVCCGGGLSGFGSSVGVALEALSAHQKLAGKTLENRV